MSYQSIPLLAGQPHRIDIAGRLILVDSVGDSDGVDIEILLAGSSKTTTIPKRKAAFRLVQQYDGIILTCATNVTVGIFLSDNDVQLGTVDGAAVTVPDGVRVTNEMGSPVPVTFTQQIVPLGSVTVNNADADAVPVAQKAGTVFESRVTNGDADAVPMRQKAGVTFVVQDAPMPVIADFAPVVVGVARSVLVLDATLKRLRIRNTHPVASVVIGGAGVTLENGPIVIGPGGLWVEDDGAAAEWYAISDTADVTMQIQGLK